MCNAESKYICVKMLEGSLRYIVLYFWQKHTLAHRNNWVWPTLFCNFVDQTFMYNDWAAEKYGKFIEKECVYS